VKTPPGTQAWVTPRASVRVVPGSRFGDGSAGRPGVGLGDGDATHGAADGMEQVDGAGSVVDVVGDPLAAPPPQLASMAASASDATPPDHARPMISETR
jgi:hypothetical protein